MGVLGSWKGRPTRWQSTLSECILYMDGLETRKLDHAYF